MNSIHPTAVVSSAAEIHKDVQVGPFSFIEENVRVEEGCRIGPYVHLQGFTTVGKDSQIFTGAVIGSKTQDLKYRGGRTYIKIGEKAVIREYVTINPGTAEGESTIVGRNNLIMAYAHIAHNCITGDNVIIANSGTLAGHVTIGDNAIIGGLVGIHQFCRVGAHSIIGGCSKITKDIIPFVMADGYPAKPHGINIIGLKRHKFSPASVDCLKKAYRLLFRSGINVTEALSELEKMFPQREIETIVEFIRSSTRGIARSEQA